MNSLKKILLKKNESIRKPYGHAVPDSVSEIIKNIDVITKEWNEFTKNKSHIGIPIDELSSDQEHLNKDKKWKAVFLYVYGEYNKEIIPFFPATTKLINASKKEIKLVFFSNLEPGKHIPPHKGNNFHVLRSQIGIDINEPEKTGLRVEDKIIQLKEKELFTFDDTFEHEAWNYGSTHRTVLIIDTNKRFPYIYSMINRFFLRKMKNTPYVQSVIQKIK